MRVISLGAGVQSTTLALMAAHGEIGPMPDCAVFADTGDEPQAVYDHLHWLMSANVLPFPIHIHGRGIALSEAMLGGNKMARPPLYTVGEGMMGRQCTRNFKIRPIKQKLRQLLGPGRPQAGAIELWIGISQDEIVRMKDADVGYITHRWPLIEQRMTRRDCLAWMESHGYPRPPKSSCWHCPYQTNAQWRDKRDNQPEEWLKAVAFDAALRTPAMVALNDVEGFLHPSKVPLAEVDLSSNGDRGQIEFGFLQECEGMCGV